MLRQELTQREDVSGDRDAAETLSEVQRETILLIHGTFANKAESAPAWWRQGSEFCHKLDSYLLQKGSPARCWAQIGSQKNEFAWTGDNLESERRIGGNNLAKGITDLEASRDINRYHLVAHSHGGNVVLHALRSLADDPRKLGAVIFLGTPVLRCRRLPPWLSRSALAMLFYGVGLVASASMLLVIGFQLWPIGFAIAFGLMLLVEWVWLSAPQLPIYGAGHAHAFEFTGDEAMKALRLSLEFARRPKDVLKQLFSTKAPRKYAVDPPVDPSPPKLWKILWLDLKKLLSIG